LQFTVKEWSDEKAAQLTFLQSQVSLPYCLPLLKTTMWANAQRDGRPAEYRWYPLFNAAKFG